VPLASQLPIAAFATQISISILHVFVAVNYSCIFLLRERSMYANK